MNEKDHLIPACVIGQFTKGKEGNNWREQKVYKFDTRSKKINLVKAKNIGWSRGEYGSDFSADMYGNESGLDPNDDSRDILKLDDRFQLVETNIPKFIEKLENKSELIESDYKKILIPYIAQIFVRSLITSGYIRENINKSLNGQGGKRRYISNNDIPDGTVIHDPKNSIQYTRKLWLDKYEKYDLYFYAIDILYDKKRRFVLSNLGIAPLPSDLDPYRYDEKMGDMAARVYSDYQGCRTAPAYLIPLSPKIVVKITPRYKIPAMHKRKMPVRYIDISNAVTMDETYGEKSVISIINEQIVKYATEFYVGRCQKNVAKYRNKKEIAHENIVNNLYFPCRIQREDDYGSNEEKLKCYYEDLEKKIDFIMDGNRKRLELIDISDYLKPDRMRNLYNWTCPLPIPLDSVIMYVPPIK
jgi:hypothetical protein